MDNMVDCIKVDMKHLHSRHGGIIPEELINLLKSKPDIFITATIIYSNFHVETNLTEKIVIKEGYFTDLYQLSKDDNGNDFYYIDFAGLGNFGGPYLKTIYFTFDEESVLYLKIKELI